MKPIDAAIIRLNRLVEGAARDNERTFTTNGDDVRLLLGLVDELETALGNAS